MNDEEAARYLVVRRRYTPGGIIPETCGHMRKGVTHLPCIGRILF